MPEQYARRRFGGRKDGRRLRTISPVFQLSPFAVLDPSDGAGSFEDSVDVAAIEAWLRSRRREGDESMSLLHLVIAAYVRTLALRPAMNRFVSGRYIYARDTIDVVLPSGGTGASDAGVMTVTVRFQPSDTVYDVYRKINARVDNLKADQSADRTERLASTLVKTPRFVLRFAMRVLRWLDYHGWLSEGIMERSPYHGSAVISDEGAFHLPPVRKSLNRLGTLPVSLSIGRIRAGLELDKTGALAERKFLDYAITYDSRIADSAYIGSAFRYFRYFLANPDALESPPERMNEDAL